MQKHTLANVFLMATRKKQTEKRELTQTQLLDAAAELFAQQGFSATSIDAIAEAAGYSRGAFYFYYPAKEDLFLALFERHEERQLASLRALVQAELPLPAKLQALEDFYASLAHNRAWGLLVAEFRLFLARRGASEERFDTLHRHYKEQIRALLIELLGEDTPSPGRIVLVLSAMVEGLSFQQVPAEEAEAALRLVFRKFLSE